MDKADRFYILVVEEASFDDRKMTPYGGLVNIFDADGKLIASCDDNSNSIAYTIETTTGSRSDKQGTTIIDDPSEIAEYEKTWVGDARKGWELEG